jgi:putative hydrolase of the HAD superfamily
MQNIKHIFFDLDRTLWDFETNSHETLLALHGKHELSSLGIHNAVEFITEYKRINELCWADYRNGTLTKEVLRAIRFQRTFEHYGIQDKQLASDFGDDYIALCPLKNKVFPHTYEVLDALSLNYQLHIITNGFEEVQHIKMKHSNLTKYFDVIVVSEEVGERKPHPKVFQYALEKANTRADQSIMIGDDLPVDILGAQAAGIQGVYFNPDGISHAEAPAFEIKSLKELLDIL